MPARLEGALVRGMSTVVVAAALLGALGGWLSFRQQAGALRDAKYRELRSIAELKCAGLRAWCLERRQDARLHSRGLVRELAGRCLEPSGGPASVAALATRLREVRDAYGYQNVILAAPDGRVVASLDPRLVELESEARRSAAAAVASTGEVMGDFFRCGACAEVHLDTVAPVFDVEGRAVAALLLRVDPERFLWPLLQSWPVPSATAETLLVGRDGGDVVFLNRLRHRPDPPLSFRLPVERSGVPAAEALRGVTGPVEGVDYRSVPVLADVRAVPGTPWFIVSKVDAEEYLAEVRSRGLFIAGLVGLGVLALGGLGAMVVARRQARLCRELEAALRERDEARDETRATLYGIGDGVISTDRQGRVTRMNQVAERLTGWSASEASGRPLAEIFRVFNEDTRAPVESPVERVLQEGRVVGLANHTVLVARDGAERPVADSGAPILGPAGEVVGVVLVFRDQTAERSAEQALVASVARFRELSSLTSDYVYGCLREGDEPYRLDWVGGAFERLTGYADAEVLALGCWLPLVHEDDRAAVAARLHALRPGDEEEQEYRVVAKGGEVRWVSDARRCVAEGGARRRLLGACRDVTAHKRSDAAQREIEERYRELFENMSGCVAVYRPTPDGRDFVVVGMNRSLERVERVRRDEVLGRSLSEVFPGVEAFGLLEVLRRVSRSGASERFAPRRYVDGRIAGWRDNFVYRLPGGEVVALYNDVTEEFEAREKLRRTELLQRSLLASIPDIVMNFDRACRHCFVSPNVSAVGLKAEDMLGKTHAELGFPPDLCRLFEGAIGRVFSGGAPEEVEFEADLPVGKRVFSWRLAPSLADDGAVDSVTTLARDVTTYRSLQTDYKQLFESMLDGFAVHEMIYDGAGRPVDYRFLSLNPAFERLTGISSVAAVGKPVSEVLGGAEARVWVEAYGAVVETGEPRRMERVSEALGKRFDVLAFRPRPGQFATIFTDVTERRRAEERLRESAAFLELAGKVARFGAWSVDLGANSCYWSDAVADIHGMPHGYCPSVEEGVSFYAPEWRARIGAVFTACAREGIAYDEELEIVTAAGERRWVRTIGRAMRDEAGAIVKVAGSFQDITDRRRVEETLREEEARFRLLAESAPEGIFVQTGGRFAYLNPAACRLFGAARPEDLLGTAFLELMAPEYRERILERVAQQTATGAPAPLMEQRYLRLDGSSVDVETTAVPIKYGGLDSHMVFVRDITEKKAIEAELRQSQKMESVGRLAGGIAHDFNNLLTVIKGYSEFVRSDLSDGDAKRADIDQVLEAAERASTLTRQLLAFSRRQILSPQVLDLNGVVGGTVKMLKRIIGEDVALQTRLAPEPCLVRVDSGQLDQVLLNLAVNARDAMPAGGLLTVSTERLASPGPLVRLTIADTGCGMSEDVRSHLFEPFFTTKERGKGTGLGLAMVYGIVKQSGGEVEVESAVGQGTTFRIYLPEVVPSAADQGAARAGDARITLRGHERVLLVEDEEVIRRLCERVLRANGYEVLGAASGPEALEALARSGKAVDLVVTDVVMPGMSGREMATRIARDGQTRRCLYISGYTDDAIVQHGVLEPGLAFMYKPFTPEALLRKVRQVLDGPVEQARA